MKTPNDRGSARVAGQPSTANGDWRTMVMSLRPKDRAAVEEAMRLAGILLGPGAPDWRKLELISAEYLSAYGHPGKRR